LLKRGVEKALIDDVHLSRGLTFYYGDLTIKTGKLTDKNTNLVYTEANRALLQNIKND